MGIRIGKVVLDDSYYGGRDLYSDGDVEEEMLRLSEEGKDVYEILREKQEWAFLYHFSPLREQILSWFPFQENMDVLEIGSGCGAVTGALLGKVRSVTSVDLSMRRSKINANRHRDEEGLRIVVGNFQDAEKDLGMYDVITLIGVFEYGRAYIGGETPYLTFLQTVKRHLRPGGRIFIAIENRFGLKYWAGCTEDHSGRLFEGLEGYLQEGSAKTFTKKELTALAEEAGFGEGERHWYYPFPDYKFPQVLFSDRRLPQTGECNRTEFNYDRLRLSLFNESAVYNSLLENDLYPEFANSFLLILGGEEPEAAYVKFATERNPLFQVRTQMMGRMEEEKEKEGEEREKRTAEGVEEKKEEKKEHLEVLKFPEGKAENFLFSLPEKKVALEKVYGPEGFSFNAVEVRNLPAYGKSLFLSYEEGESLEERLDTLLLEHKEEEANDLLLSYAGRIRRLCGGMTFTPTPAFTSVFGKVSFSSSMGAMPLTDLDLIPANILLKEGTDLVLDYEWTFSFPIPEDFLVFRFLHYYLESDGARLGLLGGWGDGLYTKAGLHKEDRDTFTQMEASFQKYTLGPCMPMRLLYPIVSPGKMPVVSMYESALSRDEKVKEGKVYFDLGRGFSEENTWEFSFPGGVIPLPEGCLTLRIDPGEEMGWFQLHKLFFTGIEEADYTFCGLRLGRNYLYFGERDPQIFIKKIPAGATSLQLGIDKLYLSKEQEYSLYEKVRDEQMAHLRNLEEGIRQRNEEIRAMKGTKAWRLYRFLKRDPEGSRQEGEGIRFHLDATEMEEGCLVLRGWAADIEGERVEISLLTKKGEKLETFEKRSARPDVEDALSLPHHRGDLGFSLSWRADTKVLDRGKIYLCLSGSLGRVLYPIEAGRLIYEASDQGKRRAILKNKKKEALHAFLRGGLTGLRDFVDWESGTGEKSYEKWLRIHRRSQGELRQIEKRKQGREEKGAKDFEILVVAPDEERGIGGAKETVLLSSLKNQVGASWEVKEREEKREEEREEGKEERKEEGKEEGKEKGKEERKEEKSAKYLLFARNTDELEPDALYEMKKAFEQGAQVVYFDEDCRGDEGISYAMKPELNSFLLESQNYIGTCFAVRREAYEEAVAFFREKGILSDAGEDALLHGILLLLCKRQSAFGHVAKVLVHRVEEGKIREGSREEGGEKREGKEEREEREDREEGKKEETNPIGISGFRPFSFVSPSVLDTCLVLTCVLSAFEKGVTVEPGEKEGLYRVRREVAGNPLVSLIVPLRDQVVYLKKLVESLKKSTYGNWELVLVDNGSKEEETLSYLDSLSRDNPRVKVLRADVPFNYPLLNNMALSAASGEYLVLLNNDIEVITPSWMEEMLGICALPQVGAVGAKLLYPDGTVQHAGVVVGLLGVAGHVLKDLGGEEGGYGNRLLSTQEVSSVTGACLMVKRRVYEEVGGLDESLAVAFNDVDFCLQIRKALYQVVFTPYALLTHYESKSRGLEDTPEKQLRFSKECEAFQERWEEYLREGDPFYSPNLSLLGTDCALRWKEP